MILHIIDTNNCTARLGWDAGKVRIGICFGGAGPGPAKNAIMITVIVQNAPLLIMVPVYVSKLIFVYVNNNSFIYGAVKRNVTPCTKL